MELRWPLLAKPELEKRLADAEHELARTAYELVARAHRFVQGGKYGRWEQNPNRQISPQFNRENETARRQSPQSGPSVMDTEQILGTRAPELHSTGSRAIAYRPRPITMPGKGAKLDIGMAKTIMLDSVSIEVHGPDNLPRGTVAKLNRALTQLDWQRVLKDELTAVLGPESLRKLTIKVGN